MARGGNKTKTRLADGDTPIIVGGGSSTIICIPNGATEITDVPGYITDPSLYQKFYRVSWSTKSFVARGIEGGDKKLKPNKTEYTTAFSKNE